MENFRQFLFILGRGLPGSYKVYLYSAILFYTVSLFLPVLTRNLPTTPETFRGYDALLWGWNAIFAKGYWLLIAYFSNFWLIGLLVTALARREQQPVLSLVLLLAAVPGLFTHQVARNENGGDMVDLIPHKTASIWFAAYFFNFISNLKA